MNRYSPDFISSQFGVASQGYLSASAADLPLIKSRLPRPETERERGIYAAIEHGIAFPEEWDTRRRRMK